MVVPHGIARTLLVSALVGINVATSGAATLAHTQAVVAPGGGTAG